MEQKDLIPSGERVKHTSSAGGEAGTTSSSGVGSVAHFWPCKDAAAGIVCGVSGTQSMAGEGGSGVQHRSVTC